MSTRQIEWLAEAIIGNRGTPGSQYHLATAKVRTLGERYEILICVQQGNNNQGYLQATDRDYWRFRADTLADLAIDALAEIQHTDARKAIREAIYDAEDAG